MARAAEEAVRVNDPDPVPEAGETVSQAVVEFEGETRAVHAGDPPLKFRLTAAFCDAAPLVKLTEAGCVETVIAAAADVLSVVLAEAVRGEGFWDWFETNVTVRLFAPAAVLPGQQRVP